MSLLKCPVRYCFLILLFVGLFAGCGPSSEVSFLAGDVHISIDPTGSINDLSEVSTNRNHLAPGPGAAILSIRVDGEIIAPESASWDEGKSLLYLSFPNDRSVDVSITERETHARLEVVAVSDSSGIEMVIWGPYPTSMNDVIGETVGVVQEAGFAVGLQALNPKTLGGFPWNENDAMPQLDIFESGDFSDLSEEGKRYVLYRVEAAKPDSLGSTLQAYTRDRTESRVIPNQGYDKFVAPAFDDGGVVGSAIALFGSTSEKALETIGAIEVAEGLPHPMLDGVWAKMAPRAAQAYVIMPFSEKTADEALDIVERAGMQILYHPDPFGSWGHFTLREDDFPNGVDGLRGVVDKAKARGMRIGGHTLSNFIQPHDPYVSPVPDERLARVGSAKLSDTVGRRQTLLTVDSADVFRAGLNSTLRTVVIGDELIQYAGVSEIEPWTLTGVTRGAFGTQAAMHEIGDEIALLDDHGYRVFLTNPELTIEMARNMAGVYASTGMKHVSFDGLEGNRSTGMGNYGEILFAQSFWDAIPDDAKEDWIVTASRTSHYFWHLYTRMNWGEPWYAGFRESQTEYRMKNQPYFKRNFMPAMLGWFSLRPETSVEDIEWMLARSAAYDAGYALSTSMEALEKNGRSDEMLDLMNRWERARLAGIFSSTQKTDMEDVAGEFHLEESADGSFVLYNVATQRLEYAVRARQPGEPSMQLFDIRNPYEEQQLAFTIRAEGGPLLDLQLALENEMNGRWLISLKEGEILQYRGQDEAIVYSPSWQVLRRISVDPILFRQHAGQGRLGIGVDRTDATAIARVEIRFTDPGRKLTL